MDFLPDYTHRNPVVDMAFLLAEDGENQQTTIKPFLHKLWKRFACYLEVL